MKDAKSIKDNEGVKKLRALIDEPTVEMMATRLDKIPFSVCPMTVQQLDEQGDIWFFSSKDSSHFEDITYDNRVQLLYLDEKSQKYISIYGNATHIEDRHKWMHYGVLCWIICIKRKDDPNLVLINLNVDNAFYWDSNQDKSVSFFKMMGSAVSDGDSNFGNKGEINLQNY